MHQLSYRRAADVGDMAAGPVRVPWFAESAAGLLGRRAECQTLDRLVADVAAGSSRALVLRGEAGVGKSALLAYLSGRTAGWRTTSAAGVESETELAYSGLHRLCAPLLRFLPKLPTPQRDALTTVFGMRPGSAPDRFLVSLATLTLLAQAAEDRPLACVVDDAQWLDRASRQVVVFAARRLLTERVALICAVRPGTGQDLTEMPTLEICGLHEADARTLLLGNLPGPVDTAVTDRIVAESHGNPLALRELPRTWRPGDLGGGFGVLDGPPVPGEIEASFTRRLRQLPRVTQLLVLAAAADPVGDPGLLTRAAERLSVDMAALVPAVDAGLLEVRSRVEFAHPLMRSAGYRASRPADRYRVHAALAEATDAEADPDRRAWHRAQAVPGPHEEVAAELVRSAGRAQARAGLAAGAAFLTRAAELTPDPARRARRALDAANVNVQAGAFDPARSMLAVARAGPIDELGLARSELIGAQLAFASGRGSHAAALLLGAARRLEPWDLSSAREAYLDAFSAAQFAARLHDGVGTDDVARAARAAPRRPGGAATAGDLLLDAFVALTDDYAAAVPVGRDALQELLRDKASTRKRLRWWWQGCVLALELWDDDSAYALSQRHLELARRSGALAELPLALGSHTPILVLCGELTSAAALVEEARSVDEVAGIREAPYGALTLAAWRGRAQQARPMIEATLRAAGSRGEGIGVAISQYAQAVLGNGLGRYDEALAAARGACADPQEWVVPNLALPELVESAVRSGQRDVAEAARQRLTTKAGAAGTAWGLGIEARCRALLSDDDTAEELFLAALGQLGKARVRAELARTHLLYGEWLRRTGRRAAARDELRIAYGMFTDMGMEGFAHRARDELVSAGATVHRGDTEDRHDLTAQEAQIAGLAREGLSNAEIGARLFISARTVEWHLRKVFTKLGVTSRRGLRSTSGNETEI